MKKIVAIILATVMMLCACALAESVLKVGGSAVVMVEADMASITLGVSKVGPDLTELQQSVNNTVADICAALEAKGVAQKDISTYYLHIYPPYDYSSDIAQMVGYSVNNSLLITTESIEDVGALIDAAFAAGANSFDSISFSVKDESQARNQALEIAVKSAFDKAEVIAKASGRAIEGIISIDETESSYNYSSNATEAAKEYAVADAAGTTVRAAQIAVSANVQITFEIR